MTLEEFGQNVPASGLLTPEEMNLSVYEKFSGLEKTSEIWSMRKRREKKIY